jgi:putative endonuclease
MAHHYFVYIMASGNNETIYIGVTNDLIRRVAEHKEGTAKGFTKRYRINRLVYFEHTDNVEGAILREKQLKNWRREWKKNLIEKENPYWEDLYPALLETAN